MAALQQVISCHGFQAKWELDPLMASNNIVSEVKTTEGMPDVKWNLQWNYFQTDVRHQLYINIESKNEIKYMINLYYFQDPVNIHSSFDGTSVGQTQILLEDVSYFNFASHATDGKVIVTVDGKFSYTRTDTISNISNEAAKFGLRLKENFPTDFDIHVDEKIIQIHKHIVAIESPVFAKMFESNFKESVESKVTITDANFETVQAAINFCYRQDISDSLQDLTKSINLLFFSDKYDCQTLKPMLETHISTKFLSKENISLLASTSDQTNSFQLRQTCIDFMCDLLKKKQGFSGEELAKLDSKFKDDVLLQALN